MLAGVQRSHHIVDKHLVDGAVERLLHVSRLGNAAQTKMNGDKRILGHSDRVGEVDECDKLDVRDVVCRELLCDLLREDPRGALLNVECYLARAAHVPKIRHVKRHRDGEARELASSQSQRKAAWVKRREGNVCIVKRLIAEPGTVNVGWYSIA